MPRFEARRQINFTLDVVSADLGQSASGGTYSGILSTKSKRKIAKIIKFYFAILLKIENFKSLSLNDFL